MTKVNCWSTSCPILALYLAMSVVSPAQNFQSIVSFDAANGSKPLFVPPVQGTDGNLYGTTSAGGKNNAGTIFKINRMGVLTTLYSFCGQLNCPDGSAPYAGLIVGTGGNLYGTTNLGGNPECFAPMGCGTGLKVTASGVLTTLHSFSGADGSDPRASLTFASDGNFYGTTFTGGTHNVGTVFKITPDGVLTTLYNFCSQADCADGFWPEGVLIQAVDGDFYGTTVGGGSIASFGTVFKVSKSGALTTLHIFKSTDGEGPTGGLVQGADANFYGTTNAGGENGFGTVFKMSPDGTLTTLYNFCAQVQCIANGFSPYGGLVLATDGQLYGTTQEGGANGFGTIYGMTLAGTLTVLHSFDFSDGSNPVAGLVQATSGSFYGTTTDGGGYSDGTVFGFGVGLFPFVSFVRGTGYVGQTGPILGQGFTGTSNVALNGTLVSFEVISDTLMEATVPAGGTTGPVTVTTPTGTLTSNVPFRVLPQLLSFTPMSGPVGTQVTITGVSLTQTSGVGFGDYSPAPFTVNSDTQVTATVPTGAQTGPVGIQTQGGIAISTQTFTVTQ